MAQQAQASARKPDKFVLVGEEESRLLQMILSTGALWYAHTQ